MTPTGVPGFGTNEVFEGQTWGAFPFKSSPPPIWGVVNSDGSIKLGSGNFTIALGSTGIYNVIPDPTKFPGLVEGSVLPWAIAQGPAPFVPGYQVHTVGSDTAVEFEFYNAASAGAPVNTEFLFGIWLTT